jgi:hypothetical protein
MPGHISFGDEEEHVQTEALAARMIEDVATQHLAAGQRVLQIAYESSTWHPDLLIVDNLRIEFASGLKINARQAHLDLAGASSEFREALRAESERQRPTAPSEIRETGERLADHPATPPRCKHGYPVRDDDSTVQECIDREQAKSSS